MNLRQFFSVIGACLLSFQAQAGLPIETWTAKSGAKVVFMASPSIPMLDVQLDLDAGSRYDPAAQAGLASLTAGLLEHGVRASAGQPTLSEAQIADGFADTGGQFSASASSDKATVRIRTLTSPAERQATLALAARIISQPSFPTAILQREKQRTIAALREADTKPATQADRAFSRALYPQHPYGYTPSAASVQAVDAAALQRFYQRYYSPKRAVLTLIGAVSRAEAAAIAEQLTSGLPSSPAGENPNALPAVSQANAAQTIRLPHPATQAHVMVGQVAVARDTPDFFPLLVGNYILGGGGFVSRLMEEVRTKRGLVYGIGSGFAPAAQAGPFQISFQTKKDQADQALQVVRETLSKFLAEGPSDAELKAAQANLINGFPLRIDSNRKLLENLANVAWYGLPWDYLDTWTEKVSAVSAEQIRTAFQRHVQPEKMVTVVVGS